MLHCRARNAGTRLRRLHLAVFHAAGGGRACGVQTWVTIEGAADPDAIDGAIDQQLGFATNFRHLSVRNLNLPLAGDPLHPRYISQDQDFPDGDPPLFVNGGIIALNAPVTPAVDIEPLAAQYDRFEVASEVRRLAFDFTGLTDGDAVDVDLIVNVRDTWKRVVVSGRRAEFCRDLPEEDISALYVVLNNHRRQTTYADTGVRAAPSARGTYRIETGLCHGWSGRADAIHTDNLFWPDNSGRYGGQLALRTEQSWVLNSKRKLNGCPGQTTWCIRSMPS